MRVVYIEDSATNIHVMRKVAREAGCDLDVAETAAAGRRLLEQPCDLLLLDLGLPDADGLTLAREVKARWPDLPIVAVTAQAMPDDQERCLAAGCTEYICKPFRFHETVALLVRYKA